MFSGQLQVPFMYENKLKNQNKKIRMACYASSFQTKPFNEHLQGWRDGLLVKNGYLSTLY